MEILRTLLVVIEALLSLMVIGIILLQKSRDQGMGLAFGSNIGESIFGSRAGNVLTRATVWLASIFMANTVALAILFAGRQPGLIERGEGARGAAPVERPAQPAPVGAPAVPAPSPAPAEGTPVTVPVTMPPSTPPAAPPAADAPPPAP